jgi:hypothetical protein
LTRELSVFVITAAPTEDAAFSFDCGARRLQNHVDFAQLIMMSELSHA